MKKISVMNPEEKMEFTLAVGLGGPSKTIYQRIIKKIYGNEKGLQVIGLLHSSPAQTVPIVLKRLKQKDDEWKRAQVKRKDKHREFDGLFTNVFYFYFYI
jgi:paired amphipathic helix protein Sin3a